MNPPQTTNVRSGWPGLEEKLRAEPVGIGWLGASVTAQREGYQPLAHQWFVERFGQPHIPIVAGMGGVGSITGVFAMDRLILKRQPSLCVVEFSSGDVRPAFAPRDRIAPAVEGIVRKLLDVGCAVALVHLYRRDLAGRPRPMVAEHERVAEHYGIPSIDLHFAFEHLFATGSLHENELFRDVVHTRPTGAAKTAALLGDAFAFILAGSARGRAIHAGPEALCADHFRSTEVLPLSPACLRHPSLCTVGRFRFFYEYVQIVSDNAIECRFDEELVGMMVVSDRESGIISVMQPDAVDEYRVWDEDCFYERFNSVVFASPIPAGTPVTIQLTDRAVDYATLRRPVENAESIRRNLKVIGFMLRIAGHPRNHE